MGFTFTGYEMRSLRKEDISLYMYLKHVALFEFIEREDIAPLQRLELVESCTTNSTVYEALVEWCDNDGFTPDPTDRGRGWVYLDQGTVESGTGQCEPYISVSGTDAMGTPLDDSQPTADLQGGIPEQSDRIKVYSIPASAPLDWMMSVDIESLFIDEDGNAFLVDDTNPLLIGNFDATYRINDSSYMIDYLDGRVVMISGTDDLGRTPTHVTYYWNYISLVDEWAAVEAAAPPVVVIDMHGTDKTGYQLGGGKKSVRKVDLHVFATNPAERNDIVEELVDNLFNKSAPLYDFPLGTMLEYDGTWYGRKTNMNKLTSLFNRKKASNIIGNMEFENVTARHVSLPLLMTRDRNEVLLSDLNAYRSKVSFDLVTYTNS